MKTGVVEEFSVSPNLIGLVSQAHDVYILESRLRVAQIGQSQSLLFSRW